MGFFYCTEKLYYFLSCFSYHHTAPINLVYALREALSILAQETLEKSWTKHKFYSEMLYKKLDKMGLTLFVNEKVSNSLIMLLA